MTMKWVFALMIGTTMAGCAAQDEAADSAASDDTATTPQVQDGVQSQGANAAECPIGYPFDSAYTTTKACREAGARGVTTHAWKEYVCVYDNSSNRYSLCTSIF